MIKKIFFSLFVVIFSAFAILCLYSFYIYVPEKVITEVAFYEKEDYILNIVFYDDNSMYVDMDAKDNSFSMRWHACFIDHNTAEFGTAKGGFKPSEKLIFYDDYLEVINTGTNELCNYSNFGEYKLLSSIKIH